MVDIWADRQCSDLPINRRNLHPVYSGSPERRLGLVVIRDRMGFFHHWSSDGTVYTHSASVLCRSAALARDPRGLKAAPTGAFSAPAPRWETQNTYWETVLFIRASSGS